MPICLSNPFSWFFYKKKYARRARSGSAVYSVKKYVLVRVCAPVLVALALARDEMANNEGEKPAAAPPTPGLSPVKMVLGLVVLLGLNYVFTDLLDESVCCSSPPCLVVHARLS